MLPQIGDTVILRHEVAYTKGEDGIPYITASRSKQETTIIAVYAADRVKVKSGDVWHVRRLADGRWQTKIPEREAA